MSIPFRSKASLVADAWLIQLWAFALPASAGSFSLAPVRIDFDGPQRTAVITVHNNDDTPMIIQSTALAWTQSAGAEQTQETQDLLVAPPVFTVAPHGEQILRVALRVTRDAMHEREYRLLLAEVPSSAAKDFNGLRMALRTSIPVFVAPTTSAHAQLQWHAARRTDGTVALSATNSGNAHLQVTDFDVSFGSPAMSVAAAASHYVLPGSTMTWVVTPPPGASKDAAISLRGNSDVGAFQAEVTSSDR